MAEFHFYAEADDVKGIFQSLSERGDLKFTPGRSYPTAEYLILRGIRTEIERALSQNRQWFITGSFTKEPLHVDKIAENRFSVRVEFDGPAIAFVTPPLNRIKDGVKELVAGNLYHPREYWNHGITQRRKVPDEVKAAYADIIKTIKLHLTKRKIDKNLWVGKHAAQLLDEGKAIILSSGKWWDGKGNFIKSNLSPRTTTS